MSPTKVAKAPDLAVKTDRRKGPRRSNPLPAPASRPAAQARRKFLKAFPAGSETNLPSSLNLPRIFFFKPMVTREAARRYGVELRMPSFQI
jgi:hypothetical protein